MTKRPRKIHNPGKARADSFEAIGLQPDAARLARNAEIQVTRMNEKRDGKMVASDVARRVDVFEGLRESMKAKAYVGCYDAARRMERDARVALDQHDKGRPMERVDDEPGQSDRLDGIVAASKRLKRLREVLPPRDWYLLNELIAPSRPWDTWRDAVAYVTGEENANAQGAVVRAACVNLRDVYRALDVVRQRAA